MTPPGSSYLPTSGEIHKGVRSTVVFLLWLPLIIVLVGVGIGIALAVAGLGLHIYLTGSMPIDVTSPFNPTILSLGVVGTIGALYLVLANVTFGTGNVDAAIDQSSDIAEMAEEE